MVRRRDKGTTKAADALVKARIRRWHDVGSGWLVIEPGKLVVYRRKFAARMEEAADFDSSLLKDVKANEATRSVCVTLEAPQDESVHEIFSFLNVRDVEQVSSVLSGLMKATQQERSRHKEETARLEREARERRSQIRREFIADVWNTAEAIWSLTCAVYSTENAVISDDWNDARLQYSVVWQQADKLKDIHDIDLTAPLVDFDENIRMENGEGVIRKTGAFLKAIAAQVLQTDALWAKWRRDEIIPLAISPNWDHLPYFLLFTAGYFETVLSSRIEDWAGVTNGLSMLSASAAVLRRCFGVDLGGLVEAGESAASERDVRLIGETTGRIEKMLKSSFNTRPFEYKETEQQLNGDRDCLLSESA